MNGWFSPGIICLLDPEAVKTSFTDQKIELCFLSFALNIEVGSCDSHLRNEKWKKE